MSVATARKLGVRVIAALVLGVCGLPAAQRALAQGVTTAAARGVVTDEAGQPVEGATIILVQALSGQRYQTSTGNDGRFFLANVMVGQYSVEARAVGYRPARMEAVTFHLGQLGELSLRMERATVELTAITVSGTVNPLINATRTGVTGSVSDSAMSRLPTLNRSFTDFLQTVPQVVGTSSTGFGASVAGGTNRANNIQIDGAVSNDLFALNSTDGVPGGRVNSRIISIDAVQEFQVQIAPADVRFGSFVGGLLNAITKSGTNQFHGSVYGGWQSDSWVGKDSAGNRAADLSQSNYAFTFGGPIMRDRLHFFVSAETRTDNRPFTGGPNIGAGDTIPGGGTQGVQLGITQQTADAVQRISQTTYGFDPGSWHTPTVQNPYTNVFVKLDWQLGTNSHLEASYNYGNGSQDQFTRSPTAALTGFRDGYQLTNSGYEARDKNAGWRLKWTAGLGRRMSNELLTSGTQIREPRIMPNALPLIMIGGDRAGTSIGIGGEAFSHHNVLNQDIFEITDNLTINFGRHVFLVGTQNQFFKFYNDFFARAFGAWTFADTTAYAAGTPNGYQIALPLLRDSANATTCYGSYAVNPQCGPLADFHVQQLGFYVQDQWTVNPRLTLTLGVRADVPFVDNPSYNRTLDSVTAGTTTANACLGAATAPATCGGINTGKMASGNWQFSPRVGFNYNARGDGSLFFRGTVGLFTGRPPYVFVSNAFGNSGVTQATLTCNTALTMPTFTTDPANQPTQCAGGAGAPTPTPSIVFFDPNFKYPQIFRASLGVDRQLPWNVVASLDGLFTRAINTLYFNDVNLIAGGFSTGEASRQLYGTMNPNGTSNTARRNWSIANDVIEHSNASRDYSWSATLQLAKRFSNGLEFTAGYNHSETYDLFSYTSDISNSTMSFSPLVGTLADRSLARSRYDFPDKVTLSGTTNLPYGVQFSLIYTGRSGQPYTYTVSGDVNGDRFTGNDVVYVPTSATDISLCPASGACTATTPTDPGQYKLLNDYINGEKCLSDRRGQLVNRNTCRDPWQSSVNARVSKGFRIIGNQRIDFDADIRNVMALLGLGGQIRTTSSNETVNLLSYQGYNTSLSRPRYRLILPQRNRVNSTLSRWQIMLGARYSF